MFGIVIVPAEGIQSREEINFNGIYAGSKNRALNNLRIFSIIPGAYQCINCFALKQLNDECIKATFTILKIQ